MPKNPNNALFKEYEEFVGKECNSLGDLDWSNTKAFLEKISGYLERVDFLEGLRKLPDNGVLNNSIIDPKSHNRNRRDFLNPAQEEISRLISLHFNLTSIQKQAEQIADHSKALVYLWDALLAYKKYHPGTIRGQYHSNEAAFCNTIEAEIQRRKDLQSASSSNTHKNVTRVDEAVEWVKNNRLTSGVMVAAIFLGAVAVFWGQIKPFAQDIRSVFPSTAYRNAPSQKEVEEWAKTINPPKKQSQKSDDIEALAPELLEANAELRSVFNRLLSNMRETLKAYQKNRSANVYVEIPELPNNVLTPGAHYNGGAIFSRDAAWSVFLNTKDSPILEIHFMDGDGLTVGGTGIGEVDFRYDLQNKIVNVTASGVGLAAFGKSKEEIPLSDFDAASTTIIRSFLEYQLKHL
jgi:hypothetical protein